MRADSVGDSGRRGDAAPQPAWSSRADRGQLLKPHLREDGVLLAEAVVLRECVLEYARPDGTTFREFVPLKTIRDSASQIAHLPVTLGHPDEQITDETLSSVMVGNVYSDEVIVADGGYTHVRIAVRKQAAKDAIDKGTQELSLGYDAQVDERPGVHPDHGRYDGTQIARSYARGGHLAIVDAARVGPEARINTDARPRFDGVATSTITSTPAARPARGAHVNQGLLPILLALGITRRFDSDDAALAAIDGALQSRNDAEEAAEAAAAEETDAAATDLETANARIAELEAELAAMKGAADADAEKADHADMAALATTLGLDPKPHVKARDLRKAIAAHRLGTLKADAADAYVDAVVDLARADAKPGAGRAAGIAAWQMNAGGNSFASTDAGTTWNRTDSGPKRRLTANEQRLATIAAARKART